jgi:putative GTP pyrophosphokinase
MIREMTKTQIDRLGERLRKGNISDDDLRLLDLYRRSFSEAYDFVVGTIRNELALEPTGRPAKSTTSISDKLHRESIRLTQIQDIAGCRLIVTDIANQESVVQSLKSLFEHTTIIDRRARPSHGYRAVHVVVNHQVKLIEIQVRTSPQHLWAELSEKYSDIVDPAIKYGGGSKDAQEILEKASKLVAVEESNEKLLTEILMLSSGQVNLTDELKRRIDELQETRSSSRQSTLKLLRELLESVEG